MENASKALIMAAGVLIGVLILSLAAFLFLDFGATSESVYSQMENQQLTQYNAQYTVYSGRKDITIYEIISIANLAKENNATTYIQKTFKTDDGTIPSTFVMKNGKVKVQKSGSLSYYRIAELFK